MQWQKLHRSIWTVWSFMCHQASQELNPVCFFLFSVFTNLSANRMQKQVEVRIGENNMEPIVDAPDYPCSTVCEKIMKNMVLTLTILGKFTVHPLWLLFLLYPVQAWKHISNTRLVWWEQKTLTSSQTRSRFIKCYYDNLKKIVFITLRLSGFHINHLMIKKAFLLFLLYCISIFS